MKHSFQRPCEKYRRPGEILVLAYVTLVKGLLERISWESGTCTLVPSFAERRPGRQSGCRFFQSPSRIISHLLHNLGNLIHHLVGQRLGRRGCRVDVGDRMKQNDSSGEAISQIDSGFQSGIRGFAEVHGTQDRVNVFHGNPSFLLQVVGSLARQLIFYD